MDTMQHPAPFPPSRHPARHLDQRLDRHRARHALRASGPAVAVAGIVLAACLALLARRGAGAFVEGGPVELASALGYAAAAAACLVRARGPAGRDRLLGAILLAVLCARELDLHKASPIGSLTRSSTYVDAATPLTWRLVAAGAMIAVLAAAIGLAWRSARRAAARWRDGDIACDRGTACVALAVVSLCLAKALDGLSRKLSGIGVTLDVEIGALAVVMEESLELVTPALLAVAALGALARARDGSRAATFPAFAITR